MTMPDRLYLYISAGPDLEDEREAIGQVIARMPISIGWDLKRTPRRGDSPVSALETIRQCHFFILILGMDITAPVGAEWDLARRAGRTVLAYLKEVNRTPAALVFVRDSRIPWAPFRTPEELGQKVESDLARLLLDHIGALGLTVADLESLSGLLKQAETAGPPEAAKSQPERGGAGGGGIILSPGRDLPPGGVLMDTPRP
jgi:hypothetical protein